MRSIGRLGIPLKPQLLPTPRLYISFTATRYLSKIRMSNDWQPPAKIEDLFAKTAGNQFAAINSPTAGARTQQALPVGTAPLQLYSLATPNGEFPVIS